MSEAGASNARVTLILGELELELQPGRTFTLGSARDCEIRVRHYSVDGHHARLTRTDHGVLVEDLGSVAGTWMDERRVDQAIVAPGQRFRIGAVEVSLGGHPPARVAPIAAGSLRARREPGFAEMMAEELRRAPWFLISAAVHAFVFLLLYHFLDLPVGTPGREVALVVNPEPAPELDVVEAHHEKVELRPDALEEAEVLADPELSGIDEPEPAGAPLEEFAPDWPGWNTHGEAMLARIKEVGGGDILRIKNRKLHAGGFGKTVSRIRRSGLDLVFVLDSTGSMGGVIEGAKRRMEAMAEVLRALVPDKVRIGVVTYRDRDPSEEYLTREVPLGEDVYRSINFMSTVGAGGGGDRPEDVLSGLREAFRQKWRPHSRRVVILIGDAPPHPYSMPRLLHAVRTFTRAKNSYLHAIITSPKGAGGVEKDVRETFRKIAEAGRGECITFENEEKVLRQVLSLAFGREYRRNIDEVYRLVEARRNRVDTRYLDMVRRADFVAIREELRKTPVPDDLIQALLRSRDLEVALFLADVLGERGVSAAGRHAAAYVLQRLLEESRPRLDPRDGKPLRRFEVDALRELIRRRRR